MEGNTLRVALACLLCVAALTAQKPGDVQIEQYWSDESGSIGLPEPKGWIIEKRTREPIRDDWMIAQEVLSYEAKVLGLGEVRVTATLLNGCRPTDRLQAIFERRMKSRDGQAAPGTYKLYEKPLVHGSFAYSGETSMSDVTVYRRAAGRALAIIFQVESDKVEEARPRFVNIASHTLIDIDPWPKRPDGFDYVRESGIVLAFAPTISGKARKQMRAIVRTHLKDFKKVHGPPALSKDAPLVVFVSNDSAERGRLVGNPDAKSSTVTQLSARRIATQPMLGTSDTNRARFDSRFWRYLLFTLYPQRGPSGWIGSGEEDLAWMAAHCGKLLPTIPEDWYGDVRRVRLSLHDLIETKNTEFGDEAAWCAFFRLGPSKFRRPYAALRQKLRTGLDPDAAMRDFVAGLDKDQLWAEARKTLRKKLKSVE